MKNIKGYVNVLMENIAQEELNEDLIYAVRMNRHSQVKELLRKGADPNCRIDGDTPLSWAAQKRHTEIMKLLLEEGADPNIEVRRNGRNISILCMAMVLADSKDSIYEMMKLLLKAGVDPNGRQSFGRTPLAILSYGTNDDWEKYELLFKYKADPNIPDYEGRVPLYWPLKWMTEDDAEIAKVLILNGADPLKVEDGASKTLELFKGNIDWWPEGPIKSRIKKMARGKAMFGM